MRFSVVAGLSITLALASPASSRAAAGREAQAKSGGKVLVVAVDASGAVLRRSCDGEPCPLGASTAPKLTPLAPGRTLSFAEATVRTVLVGPGHEVIHVRIPSVGATASRREPAWEAILAPGVAAPVFAGVTGLAHGEGNERTGSVIDIVAKGDGTSFVVVGDLVEGREICGEDVTALSPRALDPASMTLRGATMQRLPAARRSAATALESSTESPFLPPVARLLQATSASSGAGATALTDGRLDTAWYEARSGDGRGELVVLRAPSAVPLSGLAFVPPRGAKVVASTVWVATDRGLFHVALGGLDERVSDGAFEVRFPAPVTTSCLAIVLDTASESAPDVAIGFGEIAAYGPFDGEGGGLPAAARALGGSGAESVLAAEVLRRGGTKAASAVESTYEALSPEARRRGVDAALAASGCEDAASLLAIAAFDANATVANAAARHVERCGPTLAPVLEHHLNGPSESQRMRAARLLSVAAPRRAMATLPVYLGRGGREERSAFRAAMARASRSASADTLARLLESPREKAAMVELLRSTSRELPRASEAARRALFPLVTGTDEPFAARYLLLEPLGALAAAGDGEATDALTTILRAAPEPPLRTAAARLTGPVAKGADALVRSVSDPEPRVREAALLALQDGPRILRAAPPVLAGDGWSFVRAAAATALENAGPDPNADLALAKALEDESPRVRTAAANGLGARGARGHTGALRSRVADDQEGVDVRVAAAQALGRLCDGDATDDLTTLARRAAKPGVSRGDLALASAATASLGRIHPKDLGARLAPLLAPEAPGGTKRAAELALSTTDVCGARGKP